MPLSVVDAITLDQIARKLRDFYSICVMGNHALFYKELWDWLLKMADEEEDPLRNLMKPAIEEVNNRFKSVESSEIEEETFRDTLPEGYTYNIEELSAFIETSAET